MKVRWNFLCFASCLLMASADSRNVRCGFPGQPANGKVTVHVGESYKELNETNWESFSESTDAVYQCNGNHLIAMQKGDEHFRKCVNGSWSGVIPQCAEILRISKYSLSLDKKYSCFSANISKENVYRESRLHGVLLTSATHVKEIRISGVNSENRNQTLLFVEKNDITASTNYSIYFPNKRRLDEYNVLDICISPADTSFRRVELLILRDKCDHPEIPLDGQVDWNDTTATYRCHKGYELDPEPNTRKCVQGSWTGPQPVCKQTGSSSVPTPHNNLTTLQPTPESTNNPEPVNTQLSRDRKLLIGFCCATVVFISLLLFLLYRMKFFHRATPRRNQDEASNYLQDDGTSEREIEPIYDEIGSNHLDAIEDAELADRIRQNRASRLHWMEQHSVIYADLQLATSGAVRQPPPEVIYAEVRKEQPVYAQIDKSRKKSSM